MPSRSQQPQLPSDNPPAEQDPRQRAGPPPLPATAQAQRRVQSESQPGSTQFPSFVPTPTGVAPPADSIFQPQAMSSASDTAHLSRRQQAQRNRAGPTPADVLGAYHLSQARRGGSTAAARASHAQAQQSASARVSANPQPAQGRGAMGQDVEMRVATPPHLAAPQTRAVPPTRVAAPPRAIVPAGPAGGSAVEEPFRPETPPEERVPLPNPSFLRTGSRTPTPPLPATQAPDDDPEEGYTETMGVSLTGFREDIRIMKGFQATIAAATLDNCGLNDAMLSRLRTPLREPEVLTPGERAGLHVFTARGEASEEHYADVRAAMLQLHPDDIIPTYSQAKSLIGKHTGIDAVRTDMCVNTCIAYTGPFEKLDKCPECAEPRFDAWKSTRNESVPRRTFCTFPIGPQIQALWSSPESARLMRHRRNETDRIIAMRDAGTLDSVEILDDLYYSNDYLEAVARGEIKSTDTLLMFSLDGAQLYQNKSSDCWFYIWVIFDLPPSERYKKPRIFPGGVIGGPNKPKNLESFLVSGLAHVSGLQKEGLPIWEADRQVLSVTSPVVWLETADSPAMASMGGLVGHIGARMCRLYCNQLGRHKHGKPTYYPALLKPLNSQHDEQPDIDLRARVDSRTDDEQRYKSNLLIVERSRTQNEYALNRRQTGIARGCIFTALPRSRPFPRGFALDFMHLIALNLTDLLMALFRGTLACDEGDDVATWPWAVLLDKTRWHAHGRLVADATQYLPGSFDRPPRNPAEKISSGYKAWEYLLYVYGLLPGLLRPYLPPVYYSHFCKLVFAIRILLQRSLRRRQLPTAKQCIVEYVTDFETLYYQQRAERLHFVRPSLHTLTHLVVETERTGLGPLYSQWTLENFIGNITREIAQHVTPYANVSERALRRCQVNALRAMDPDFALQEPTPRHSHDLGNNYTLLSPFEDKPYVFPSHEHLAIQSLCARLHIQPVQPNQVIALRRWARLKLPSGQIARTAWKEQPLEASRRKPRRARMVKIRGDRFAEVQYFFQNTVQGTVRTFAMVSMFSPPDPSILAQSIYTVLACKYQGHLNTSYEVIAATDITTVVAMVPLPRMGDETTDHFFVVEKPGLDLTFLSGAVQSNAEGPDDL